MPLSKINSNLAFNYVVVRRDNAHGHLLSVERSKASRFVCANLLTFITNRDFATWWKGEIKYPINVHVTENHIS